jgi:signal transduction histidine kinase/DNA-binding NarL/FixJ family response regulator
MGNPCQILIIDDSEADRAIYSRYLLKDAHQDFNILEAETITEGIERCEQNNVELVLLDYGLPDGNGLDFIRWWQASPVKNTMAVVMMTGYGDEAIAVQAIKLGALDYISKQNLSPERLHHTLHNALAQLSLRQQLQQFQERRQLLATTALQIRSSLDLEQILSTAVDTVRQLWECDRAIIYQFSAQHPPQRVAASMDAAFELPTDSVDFLCLGNPSQTLGSTACSVALSPVGMNDAIAQSLDQLQAQALLEVPIRLERPDTQQPELWGALVIHHCQMPRVWQEEEVKMMDELGVHLAIAIHQAELLSKTQRALLKEQELNQFKSKIVTTVSHEYRTPLTAILASAATLERHPTDLGVARNRKLLGYIQDQARRLQHLVNDMMVANQVELGQIQFKPFPLNLEALFQTLVDEYQLLAHPDQNILLEIEGNHSGFWGDVGLLRQIFGNLITNALKYSPNAKPVILRLKATEAEVEVQVIDYGIGILEADLPTLFESFTRGSNVDTIPGTGLGLAIARACTELHQGKLTIHSQINQGTEVCVWFPKQVSP